MADEHDDDETETSIVDDLRKLMHASSVVGAAIKHIDEAASGVLGKARATISHVTHPDTLGKALGVGVSAAFQALGQEAMDAASRPPPPSEPPPPPVEVRVVAPPPAASAPSSSAPDSGEIIHWRRVHDDFLEARKACGQTPVTFDRLAALLQKNRDAIIAAEGRAGRACVGARFSVIIQDDKAALRGHPVTTASSTASTASTASAASTPPTSAAHRFTACEVHGRRPWTNTIKCQNCRRVFHVDDPSSSRAAPDRCPCGSQLLPEPVGQRPQPFSGKPVCPVCFTEACTIGGGFAR